jgi:hypothetical protein
MAPYGFLSSPESAEYVAQIDIGKGFGNGDYR